MCPSIWVHWRHLANMIEPSVCGGDAVFCQITLTTAGYPQGIRWYTDYLGVILRIFAQGGLVVPMEVTFGVESKFYSHRCRGEGVG